MNVGSSVSVKQKPKPKQPAVVVKKPAKESNVTEAIRVIWQATTFDVFTVAYPKNNIEILLSDDRGTHLRSMEGTASYFKSKKKKLIFAMNGGMYNESNDPVGLLIVDGRKLSDIDRNSNGYGNFYMQPNGVFALTSTGALLVSTTDYKDDPNIRFATQSGPLMVSNGVMNSNFKQNSPNKNIRNGVGIRHDGTVVFAISNQPVNFHDFATLFRDKLNCKSALYLDGVISKMYLPKLNRLDTGGNFGPIITVTER